MDDEPIDDPPDWSAGGALIDQFYRGTVVKLRRGTRSGVVRSATTRRELPFFFQHVRFVGLRQRYEDLREGMVIGYDVSWTSKGLWVSVIFIPD
jgi:hypothetical protein